MTIQSSSCSNLRTRPPRTRTSPQMVDRKTPELSDHDLATHPTVYAADALKNQVALVSGGAGGIGRAIAWLFARLGAHVVLAGSDQEKLDTLVADLIGRNLKASAHAAEI